MPRENGRHGRPSWIFKIFIRNLSPRDMGLPTLKVSWTSYERFSSYRSNNFVAKRRRRRRITRGNGIFLRAKMKSYNATWIVDMIFIKQIITWRRLCNVIMSIVAACSMLLSRTCQGQYVTSAWPWDQSGCFYRDRNIRKPHCSILYGFIVNFTLNVTERSNSDLRGTLTQNLTLPLWPPSQQTPIRQDILLYNE